MGLSILAVREAKFHAAFKAHLFPGIGDFKRRENRETGREVVTTHTHTHARLVVMIVVVVVVVAEQVIIIIIDIWC